MNLPGWKVRVPFSQSIIGLYFFSHGSPRIMVSFPMADMWNFMLISSPPMHIFSQVKCVMLPAMFRVPSTLNNLIVAGCGIAGSWCFRMYSLSMNTPCTPGSMSACSSRFLPTVLSHSNVTGILNDLVFGVAMITRERHSGAGADIGPGCHFKNPIPQFCQRTSSVLHHPFLQSWL